MVNSGVLCGPSGAEPNCVILFFFTSEVFSDFFTDLFIPVFFSSPLFYPLPPSSLLCRCPFPSERQARLEAVREVFLAAYSSTVGLKSSAPSPSGAISGLLEQFARGVGLRSTNAIVWTLSMWHQTLLLLPSIHPQLIQHVWTQYNKVPNISVQFRGGAFFSLWILIGS